MRFEVFVGGGNGIWERLRIADCRLRNEAARREMVKLRIENLGFNIFLKTIDCYETFKDFDYGDAYCLVCAGGCAD